jgi:hypothetical protein
MLYPGANMLAAWGIIAVITGKNALIDQGG